MTAATAATIDVVADCVGDEEETGKDSKAVDLSSTLTPFLGPLDDIGCSGSTVAVAVVDITNKDVTDVYCN